MAPDKFYLELSSPSFLLGHQQVPVLLLHKASHHDKVAAQHLAGT